MITTLVLTITAIFVGSTVSLMVAETDSEFRRSRFLRQLRNSSSYSKENAREFRDELLTTFELL